MQTVIVVGGGAAGLMAALTAAQSPDRRVILLERQQRVGRKLLATGNGRCNLTNTGAELSRYHGEDPAFVLPALNAFPPEETLAFFHSLGLLTAEEYGGRVYPLSNSANSVLDVLRLQLDKTGVEQHAPCPVQEIHRRGRGFALNTGEGEMTCDKLIVACGGCAGAKLGGVMDGYTLLKPLGHKRTGLYPALVQLLTEPDYPRALKGVRVQCALRLLRRDYCLAESRGELQFTDTGVSGPAVFDLSRAAATGGTGLTLHAALLPLSAEELGELLLRRQTQAPEAPASELFTGMLHNRLGRMVVKYAGLGANTPIGDLDREALDRAVRACLNFSLPVRGTEGFDHAQVTAGGLRTADFDPETLESRLVPGLFVCGELLDIDGDCGGFNLQWAWSSGRLAGRLGR